VNNATIEDLAYIIRNAKEKNKPLPIFFLGAGASKSGNIPLAPDICKDILEKYHDNPKIKKLKDKDNYQSLMGCLTSSERNTFLRNYIKESKVNVTHLYLAQFMAEGYVDYILTTNFDDLTLRALALFNEFPPIYDLSMLHESNMTTSRFQEKSVIFLHGQHQGLWLLNTTEEVEKVSSSVRSIFDTIKDGRTWVVIGYSGDDPIFDHIKSLGKFDDHLYWVTYKDHDPNNKVMEFLDQPNDAFVIKGFDADSFMIKLNNKLELGQPKI
jgi:hypothetical protein